MCKAQLSEMGRPCLSHAKATTLRRTQLPGQAHSRGANKTIQGQSEGLPERLLSLSGKEKHQH